MNEIKSAQQHKRSANGLKNWLRLMLIISLSIFALDNYKRFGIVMDPLQIVKVVCLTVYNHLWLYGIMLLCLLQQMVQTLLIEKLLDSNRISERNGMTLHAVNAFFVAVAFVITVRLRETNIGVIRIITPTLVLCSIIKTWSYAYVNKTLRKQAIKKDDGILPRYPSNVTLRNVFTYILCTPAIQYQLSYPDRSVPTTKDCVKQLFIMFSVICTMAFVGIQFILPELQLLKQNDFKGIEVVECFFRIMVFLHLLWLLGYVLFYRTFHPTYALLTGMPNLVFENDWWNSPDMDEFWRRWNHPVYNALKETVMIPLLRKNCSKRTTKIVSFLIAGILHEFVNTLPLGVYSGAGIFVTLTEIPLGYFSKYIRKEFGDECGNTLIWFYLNVSHSTSIVVAYLCYEFF